MLAPVMIAQTHPKAQATLIFGILSIASLVTTCLPVGITMGILAIIWGGKVKKDMAANPGAFVEGNAGIGRILGIIGLGVNLIILSIAALLWINLIVFEGYDLGL